MTKSIVCIHEETGLGVTVLALEKEESWETVDGDSGSVLIGFEYRTDAGQPCRPDDDGVGLIVLALNGPVRVVPRNLMDLRRFPGF